MNNTVSPFDSCITSLINGYEQFKLQYFKKTPLFSELVQQGQKPQILMIACCDSRVDPAILTSSQPGELFVVRNVANLVSAFDGSTRDDATRAALEFGVLGLGVSHIIILAHSHCGGIRALMQTEEKKEGKTTSMNCIDQWMDIARPAKQRVLAKYKDCSLDEKAYYCEKESLLFSLNNLMSFPWINHRVLENQLFLHAWYFDLDSGEIETYSDTIGRFIRLV